MMIEQDVSIAELIRIGALDVGDGYRTKQSEHASVGFRIVRVADVNGGAIKPDGSDFVSEKFLLAIGQKAGVPGDVLLTTKGTVGRVAIVPDTQELIVYSPQLCYFRVRDKTVIQPRYLAFWFGSDEFKRQASHRMNNTDMAAYINLGDIRSLRLSLPPVETQRAIAEVLGALDDKIAANIKLADSSFGLAQILFTEAKKQSGRQEAVGAIATTVLGGTPSRAVPEYWAAGTVPWLNSGKANEDRITIPSEYITEEALARSAAKLMPEGSTVIAITGATLGQVARLEIAASGNQSLVGIWSDKPAMNDWLHFAIRDNISELLKRSTGAAQQHVNKRDVDALVIPVVSESELDKFGSRVGPLLNIAANTDRQSSALAILRDALLPELMSGRLRVKDAEKKIEEVV